MAKGRELSANKDWRRFKMHHDKLETSSGQRVTPQQILTGLALLEIQSELEISTSTYLVKVARALAKL